MDFTKVIKKKYLANGEAIEYLKNSTEIPEWMLTANGIKIKEYADKTIRTFSEETGKNQDRKNFVETHIQKSAMNYCKKVDTIVCITGPNIHKHLDLYVRSGFTKTMHVPEINPFTHIYMHNIARRTPEFYTNMLNLHFAPVQTFKIDNCRFADLDLMKTFKEVSGTVKTWLTDQSKLSDCKKAFTFTVAIRNDGGDKARFNHVSNIMKILGAKLKSVDGNIGLFPSAREYADKIDGLETGYGKCCYSRNLEFSHMGRIDDVITYQYSDGSPMLSVLILYR